MSREAESGIWSNVYILQDGIIAKYHVKVMLLFLYNRNRRQRTRDLYFVTVQKNIHRPLHSLQSFHVQAFIYVLEVLTLFLFTVFVGEVLYFLSGNLAAIFWKVKT